MNDDVIVDLQHVTKRFAGHTAVRDLSLRVPRGSVYGLLGPNGAGKTTSIRMVMNIIAPDEGAIRLFDLRESGQDLSRRIGYLPEERGLYKKMRVLDLLVFLAETKGVDRKSAKRQARQWIEELGLGDWVLKRVNDLSKGMQQKVQFIATVLHEPELLILDEPFSGFDPVNTQIMKDVVVRLARNGTTVLFSTHIMEQAEKLCDSVCIIAKGSKVLDGRLAEIKRDHGGRTVTIAVDGGVDALHAILEDGSLVAKADRYPQYAEVELVAGASPQTLLEAIVRQRLQVRRFEAGEASLHKIFVDLVGKDAATPRAEEDRHHA
jgi:ABC-2 type transport system ATP-binding protein